MLRAGGLVCAVVMLCLAAQAPALAQANQQPPGAERKPGVGDIQAPSTGNKAQKQDAAPADKPMTPLQAVLKDGIPDNAIARARMRDSLYALLATAADEQDSKRISRALNQVYLTSGSPTVDLLMKRGIAATKAKKYDTAIEFLTAVTDLAPDYAEGWNRRAFAFYQLDNLRQAAGDLRRALALDPNHYRALDGLGTILQETGEEPAAFKVYQRLIEINPHMPKAKKAFDSLKQKVEGRGI